MCYAALTKGTLTLQTAVLIAAERLGLRDVLWREFEVSQTKAAASMTENTPFLPADSARWVGEMEEISATFTQAGLPSGFHEAAADIFRLLARSQFASETPRNNETRPHLGPGHTRLCRAGRNGRTGLKRRWRF